MKLITNNIIKNIMLLNLQQKKIKLQKKKYIINNNEYIDKNE